MSAEPEYASEMYEELEIKPLGTLIALVILGAVWLIVKARENWLVIAGIAVWGVMIAAFLKIGAWLGWR